MVKVSIVILIVVFLLVPVSLYAASGTVLSGVMSISETKTNSKTKTEQVKFAISDTYARIDASSKVYYLINLEDETTFVINNKRKTITKTYASSVLDQPLPPLAILKSRSELKKYLTSTNAQLDGVIKKGLMSYEIWTFSIDKVSYKVQVKLPEYFPEIVEITSPQKKVVITVLESMKKPFAKLAPGFFVKPEHFNIVDLTGK